MKSEKILIADDEMDFVESLRAMLESRHYTVFTAFDGVGALEIARRESPDLILLDLMMPKLDGYKVCRLLKFDARYKQTAVVVLSARIQPEDARLAVQCGADLYLTKPYDPEKLLEELKRQLEYARERKEWVMDRRSSKLLRELS